PSHPALLPSFPTRRSSDLGNEDTLYRVHGSPEWWSIGKSVSSGCVRMINQDVIDLYDRVPQQSPIIVTNGVGGPMAAQPMDQGVDRKSTRLNSSHVKISYA